MNHPIHDLINAKTEEQAVKAMQKAINAGTIWRMEGSMGRAAMDMLRAGKVMLGTRGFTDYYGNYIPSRHQVQRGTLGSREYCKRLNWGDM